MESRAYFGALLLNKHCQTQLNSEQKRLDRQKKLMYNWVWKQKELLMDDFVHINVRTPSPQRSKPSSAASGRQRPESSTVARLQVQGSGSADSSDQAGSRESEAVECSKRPSSSASANHHSSAKATSEKNVEDSEDRRKLKFSTEENLQGVEASTSSVQTQRRSLSAETKLQKSLLSDSVDKKKSGSAAAQKPQKSVTSGAVPQYNKPESLSECSSGDLRGQDSSNAGLHRRPSADSVSSYPDDPDAVHRRQASKSASQNHNPSQVWMSNISQSSPNVRDSVPPFNPVPKGEKQSSPVMTDFNQRVSSAPSPRCSKKTSAGDDSNSEMKCSFSATLENQELDKSRDKSTNSFIPRKKSGIQTHAMNRKHTSHTNKDRDANPCNVSKNGPEATDTLYRKNGHLQHTVVQEGDSEGPKDTNDVPKIQTYIKSSEASSSNPNEGHLYTIHPRQRNRKQACPVQDTTRNHNWDENQESQPSLNDTNTTKEHSRSHVHKKPHVRQMTLDPKLVLPLTSKRYRCRKVATIIPVIAVYGRQATLYPNSEAKVGRVVTLDRRARGWIERSTSILSCLEKIQCTYDPNPASSPRTSSVASARRHEQMESSTTRSVFRDEDVAGPPTDDPKQGPPSGPASKPLTTVSSQPIALSSEANKDDGADAVLVPQTIYTDPASTPLVLSSVPSSSTKQKVAGQRISLKQRQSQRGRGLMPFVSLRNSQRSAAYCT